METTNPPVHARAQLFSAIPSVLIGVDGDNAIIEWNEMAEATVGVPASEVMGRSILECPIPWDSSRVAEAIELCRQTGTAAPLDNLGYTRPDGATGLLGFSVNPSIPAKDGQISVVLLGTDITERLRAKRALQEAEARFRYLVNSNPSVIYTTSPDGNHRRTFVSQKLLEVMGSEPQEAIKDPEFWLNRLHPDEASHVVTEVLRQAEDGGGTLEYRIRHQDGHYLWIHDRHELVCDNKGKPLEIIGSWTDITQRRQAEERRKGMELQLRQAQKLEAIGQLAAGIAHEINTPTQFVGDNVRFLRDAFGDLKKLLDVQAQLVDAIQANRDTSELLALTRSIAEEIEVDYLMEEIPRAVEQTLGGVQRIAEIVRAMKEFSHPGTDEKTLTDLNKAIENTMTVSSNEWKYVAEIEKDFAPDLPPVPCLPGELNQTILNLIVNAAHAIRDVLRDGSTDKGTITIRTRHDARWAEIMISDTGAGIPEDIKTKIFDPFFTTKEVGEGTGQGLALAHSTVVDKHKGFLDLESEVGKGTTFVIRLPLADPQVSGKGVAA